MCVSQVVAERVGAAQQAGVRRAVGRVLGRGARPAGLQRRGAGRRLRHLLAGGVPAPRRHAARPRRHHRALQLLVTIISQYLHYMLCGNLIYRKKINSLVEKIC